MRSAEQYQQIEHNINSLMEIIRENPGLTLKEMQPHLDAHPFFSKKDIRSLKRYIAAMYKLKLLKKTGIHVHKYDVMHEGYFKYPRELKFNKCIWSRIGGNNGRKKD